MTENHEKKDPQSDLLTGHAAFGVDYVPKKHRAQVVNGRVFGGKVFEIPSGKAKAIPLDRFTIALFRVEDEYYAIKDACPHAEYPLSKSQLISRYTVMCTSHNWQFDIRDGHCVKIGHCGHAAPDLSVRTFPIEREGEDLWVVVEAKDEPSELLRHHLGILLDSYRHWTGRDLLPTAVPKDIAATLFDAPFVVVSHGSEADPILNYGNRLALELWELSGEELVRTPSRLTAESPDRAERARLLAEVTEHGYIDDYSGVRISKSGRRFRIEGATVWNLMDEAERYCGQAATFSRWTFL